MTETSLPYAGTSGHSGTDTSRERAERADTSGKTTERQRAVLNYLDESDRLGVTVKDVREVFGWHHGVASSVLTNLHITGRIERLTEKRDRCHVYVMPDYVNGRDLSAYTPNKRNRPSGEAPDFEIEQIEEAAFTRGHNAALASITIDDISHRIVSAIETYLDEREAIPTSVAWIADLRKIMKEEGLSG